MDVQLTLYSRANISSSYNLTVWLILERYSCEASTVVQYCTVLYSCFSVAFSERKVSDFVYTYACKADIVKYTQACAAIKYIFMHIWAKIFKSILCSERSLLTSRHKNAKYYNYTLRHETSQIWKYKTGICYEIIKF